MLISSRVDTSVYGIRWNAYQDVLRQRGLEHNLPHVVESHYICSNVCPVLTEYLTLHPEITAVCSAVDVATPAAVRAVSNTGRTPGKDVAIISFDGMEALQYCIPSITTFEKPEAEMTNYVYDLLLGLIDGKGSTCTSPFRPNSMKTNPVRRCNRNSFTLTWVLSVPLSFSGNALPVF